MALKHITIVVIFALISLLSATSLALKQSDYHKRIAARKHNAYHLKPITAARKLLSEGKYYAATAGRVVVRLPIKDRKNMIMKDDYVLKKGKLTNTNGFKFLPSFITGSAIEPTTYTIAEAPFTMPPLASKNP